VRKLSYHGEVESHHFIKYKEKKDKKYGFVTFEESATADYWIRVGKISVKNIEIIIKPYKGPGKAQQFTKKSHRKSINFNNNINKKQNKYPINSKKKAQMRRGYTAETQALVYSSQSLSNPGYEAQKNFGQDPWQNEEFDQFEYEICQRERRLRESAQMMTPNSIESASNKIRRRKYLNRGSKESPNNQRKNDKIRQISQKFRINSKIDKQVGYNFQQLSAVEQVKRESIYVKANHFYANLQFNQIRAPRRVMF